MYRPSCRRANPDVLEETMMTGSCLCGGVKYTIDGELGPVALCHCQMCRKASGTAFATNASVARAAFQLVAGDSLVRRYESSPGKWRCFCAVCGSPLFGETIEMPDHVRIRLGLLEGDPGVRPAYHFAVNFKAPWWEIADGLPQLDLS
jgi:hypothetical protein